MKGIWDLLISPVREIVSLLRKEKPLWAIVEPAGPDKGWDIRAVHKNDHVAHLVCLALNDAKSADEPQAIVRRHDLVQRDNREIAARVYRQGN